VRTWTIGLIYVNEMANQILRTPYVWAAVEELAAWLEETYGEYEILAKDVRQILIRTYCKKHASPKIHLGPWENSPTLSSP
jgi:hypothetical protein